MTVHPGLADEFDGVAREMVRSTRAEDQGCITYTIHRVADDPHKFILYEQWRDQQSLDAHLARLIPHIGQSRFVSFFESTSAVRLDPIE